jgi:hypothetical protein
MKVIKFAPGLIPVLKHGTHDQKTHGNWAHGSSFGEFTLEEGADSRKLATYTHPNGTRVIFQNLSKVESSSPMVKETLETVDALSKKYPVPNLTFVVQSGEGGGIVSRGFDGVCYSPARNQEGDRMQAYLEQQKMPLATDPNAPYIAIRQRVIAPDSMPRVTYVGAGGVIRPQKTQEQKTAYLKEMITHEWGHALDKRSQADSNIQFRNRDATSTSRYGNKNGREFFAETFAAFELGGLVKDRPDNIPNYKKASEYLEMDSLKGKVSKESFEGFVVYENFETGEPLLIEGGTPSDFDESVQKHQEHDQSSHGNWAEGSQGTSTELSANEIADIISNSTTVNEMYQKVAERLGKSMKPQVADLSEEETNYYRGVTDVDAQAESLLNGKIPFGQFHTWGQGIYVSSEPTYAETYGELIRLKLDKSAKLVEGEIAWSKAFSLFDKESSLDMPTILDRITSGKMDNFSDSDIANVYWAAKGYDGFSVYATGRQEVVLFNSDKLTVNKADIGSAVKKHGTHDQKTHGSWATGNYENLNDWIKEELSVFSSDADREKYIEDTINSQRVSGYDNTKYSGAVERYESKIGYDINEALRDPQISDDGYMNTVSELDEAIDAIEPISQEVIAYRGVKGNGLDFFETKKVGDTWEDKGFTSTTIDPYIAKQFGGVSGYYEGIVFKYKLPAGTKGIFPSNFTDKSTERDTSEAEFLLPRNSKFKIVAQRGKVWDVELIP